MGFIENVFYVINNHHFVGLFYHIFSLSEPSSLTNLQEKQLTLEADFWKRFSRDVSSFHFLFIFYQDPYLFPELCVVMRRNV